MQSRLRWMLVLGSVGMGVAVCAGSVRATPSQGFTSTTIALGRFADIDVSNHVFLDGLWGSSPRKNPWLSFQKTHGPSDLYVQSNLWTPGGSTGWHTHPGHSLITVTHGELTAYDGDDPSCTPKVYTPGMGLVDPGGGHVHLIRNEGLVDARTITVQLIPATAMRRIDAPDPGVCPF